MNCCLQAFGCRTERAGLTSRTQNIWTWSCSRVWPLCATWTTEVQVIQTFAVNYVILYTLKRE